MATGIILEATNGADTARITGVLVASGDAVSAGQALFEIENHKVVQEIEAAVAGRLVHALAVGDLVQHAVPIAFIADDGEDTAAMLVEAARATLPPSAPAAGKPVSVAKATEIAVLGGGAGNSLLASLGASVGPIARRAETPAFFREKILDLLVYEAARLLTEKRFRVLNARYSDGLVTPQQRIKAGISFDEGRRLTLYALPDPQTMTLAQVQDGIVDGLMRYVGQKLSLEEVATSTFTISDVSAVPLSFSVPLLPVDQCFIIAVTRDEGGAFGLNMSFDHRVTEGLVAANFAQELIKRIRSYAVKEAVAVPTEQAALAAVCSFCERTVESEVSDFRRRGLLKIVDASHSEVLCCTSCWEGW